MEKVHDEEMLRECLAKAVEVSPKRPVLIDRFLEDAIEAEAEAIAVEIATVKGISAHRQGHSDLRSLQQYHAGIGV